MGAASTGLVRRWAKGSLLAFINQLLSRAALPSTVVTAVPRPGRYPYSISPPALGRLTNDQERINMEYLVSMTTRVPDGTSDQEVEDIRTREAARSHELAKQ